MKLSLQIPASCALAVLLCSCASTSLKETWKAPDHTGGPVQKIALLGVDDRQMVRQAAEGQFLLQLEQRGQPALRTSELAGLSEIKADKQGAAARFRQAGADSILIVRLVDSTTHAKEVRETSRGYAPTISGYDPYDWYGYYSLSFMDMGTTRLSVKQDVFLETSLYELANGKRLWSGLTKTTVGEDTDRVEEFKRVAAIVLAGMQKDGYIR
jgi:hypothetical protein